MIEGIAVRDFRKLWREVYHDRHLEKREALEKLRAILESVGCRIEQGYGWYLIVPDGTGTIVLDDWNEKDLTTDLASGKIEIMGVQHGTNETIPDGTNI